MRSNRERNKQRALVSGISNQGKLFYLSQISEKGWHRGLSKDELEMQRMPDAPVQTTMH
jgi:hypothetical protein